MKEAKEGLLTMMSEFDEIKEGKSSNWSVR